MTKKEDPHTDKPAHDDGQPHPETDMHTAEQKEKKETQSHKTITISEHEMEQLKKELSECKDKYLRSLAESENARKRLQKEKQEMIQYATQNLVVDFLNPIDHMESALKFTQQMSDEVKHWAVGFQMILTQFKDVLTMNGVAPFASEGKPFDPHKHEAIETVVTTDFPPGTVIEETARGYAMGDKTIRPARVKVSKTSATQPANNQNNQDN